ncbi:MAG: hypothetical protein K8W52_22780 [Deltaproteobacteria bacterium]|nr:hypothetical protein [Deltaproteobacteria bacterium]
MASEHFGPWPFGAAQNPAGTVDFVVDELVVVELDGPKERYTVRSVVRVIHRAGMPAGTECEAFAALAAATPADWHIDEHAGGRLRLWLGDCCGWCGPSWLVTFDGVSEARGLEAVDGEDPAFRFASDDEIRANALEVPLGARAYRIILTHGAGDAPAPDVFVVATGVAVARVPAAHR